MAWPRIGWPVGEGSADRCGSLGIGRREPTRDRPARRSAVAQAPTLLWGGEKIETWASSGSMTPRIF